MVLNSKLVLGLDRGVKFILLSASLITVLTGCGININSTDTTSTNSIGGLFFSESKGDKWAKRSAIMGTTQVSSFSGADVWTFVVDPSDRKALYVGTQADGLFFSLDSGAGWQHSNSLGSVFVRSIAIDPQFSCTLYVTVTNKLLKSVDCTRTWQTVYVDNDQAVTINSVVVDPKNGSKIYIATSRGEVLKSVDRGNAWQAAYRIQGKIAKLFINPKNVQNIYASSDKFGLSVTTNSGSTWDTLDKQLTTFDDSVLFKDMSFSGLDVNRIFIATRYGLLRTDNGGKNWSKIDLITPKDKATINALAVNPQNDLELYYVTNSTFYRSVDGGKTWKAMELPTSRIGSTLTVDSRVPNWLFMGVREIKK